MAHIPSPRILQGPYGSTLVKPTMSLGFGNQIEIIIVDAPMAIDVLTSMRLRDCKGR
jgi:hypothetical protein